MSDAPAPKNPHTDAPIKLQAEAVFPDSDRLNYPSPKFPPAQEFAAMTPTDSPSAGRLLPSLAIDVSTADALLKVDQSGVNAKISSGGGPYQALRALLPETYISDQDLAKAAAVIRDTREPATLKAGDPVPTGKAYLDGDLNTVIEARVRQGLGLPPNATEDQVHAKLEANEAALARNISSSSNVNPTMNETQFPEEK
jgi:hypothetical protein